MNFKFSAAIAAAALGIGLAGAANAATIEIAGQVYDEAAGADGITVTSGTVGSFDLSGGGASVNEAIGGGAADGVSCSSDGCSFLVNFDNAIVNQDGDDLVLYGLGVGSIAEYFNVSYNGVELEDLAMTATGSFLNNFQISHLYLDLSDLGVALGDALTSFQITVKRGINTEEFVAAVSLNDEDVLVNPIPAAAWLFGSALIGGGYLSRKRKKAA
ncbi:hypothetical protein [Hyphococcus sp.]|jgi:hypothetical protein|uniref:hypothetical protein n=1 Tax=Hyphococcus sp. TaxID=2038636 RepID=UPI003D1299B8